jgi:hypothetical protein
MTLRAPQRGVDDERSSTTIRGRSPSPERTVFAISSRGRHPGSPASPARASAARWGCAAVQLLALGDPDAGICSDVCGLEPYPDKGSQRPASAASTLHLQSDDHSSSLKQLVCEPIG